ncbi:uncharacterized protein LOC115660041 isoform X3 [Gopherus evgoodei]|uniref:uncharacterized protein LOC115660041 isoform X3 n=1 Tax=Gopherus evgoodei TaxID=1825980 RepID=UPI0011D022C5|nr:uncharacterized protein LOC115660041 isoform X3 [Gopherus evgoodei]
MGHWMRGRRASWEWGARGFADPWISDFCVRPSPTLPDSGSLFVLQPGSQRLHGTLGRAGPQAGRRAKMKSGRAQAACLGPEQGSLESPTPGVQRLFPISLGSLQSLSLHGAGRKRASHGSAAWERGAELTMRHCNAPGKASTPSTTLSLPPSLARPIWLPRSFPGRSESVFTASQRSTTAPWILCRQQKEGVTRRLKLWMKKSSWKRMWSPQWDRLMGQAARNFSPLQKGSSTDLEEHIMHPRRLASADKEEPRCSKEDMFQEVLQCDDRPGNAKSAGEPKVRTEKNAAFARQVTEQMIKVMEGQTEMLKSLIQL